MRDLTALLLFGEVLIFAPAQVFGADNISKPICTDPPFANLQKAQVSSGEIVARVDSKDCTEKVLQEYQKLFSATIQPAGSGPFLFTRFSKWAYPQKQPKGLLLDHTTTMNCLESILFAAYRARAISWNWLHKLYTPSYFAKDMYHSRPGDDEKWAMRMINAISKEPPKALTAEARPQAGDIVFFGGTEHVTMATGQLASDGSPELLSFNGNHPGFRVYPMSRFLKQHPEWHGNVTFARPSWAKSGDCTNR